MIAEQDIIDIIIEAETATNMDKLTPKVILSEIGTDSLDMSNIFLSIEEKYGIVIPDEDIGLLDSVENILKYINERS